MSRWFIIGGLCLLVIGGLRWLARFKPYWNWIAIIFFSLSAVIGFFIYLVQIEALLPVPLPEPPAVAVIAPLDPSFPTIVPLVEPTETPWFFSDLTATPSFSLTGTSMAATIQPVVTARVESTPTPAIREAQAGEVLIDVSATPLLEAVEEEPAPVGVLSGYVHRVQLYENLTCITQNFYEDDRFLEMVCQYNQSLNLIGENCGEYLAPGRRLVMPSADLIGFGDLPPLVVPPHQSNACGLADG